MKKALLPFLLLSLAPNLFAQKVGIGTATPQERLHIEGGNIKFPDNGDIISADINHRLRFRRTENIMELQEYGDIIFSAGAVSGTQTGTMFISYGQRVGIGTTTPNASSILDLNSTTSGFLPPRMTQVQRDGIATPPAGLMVYCNNCGTYGQTQTFNGTKWLDLTGKPAATAPSLNGVSIGQNFGGGILAYILQPGDPGYDGTTAHGIIAYPSDIAPIQWYNGNYFLAGAFDFAIGTGKTNTNIISKEYGTGSYAASVCLPITNGMYNDWVLPSQNDLLAIYPNRAAIGGFDIASYYWSSSENSSTNASTVYFGTGLNATLNKSSLFKVRAVRYF